MIKIFTPKHLTVDRLKRLDDNAYNFYMKIVKAVSDGDKRLVEARDLAGKAYAAIHEHRLQMVKEQPDPPKPYPALISTLPFPPTGLMVCMHRAYAPSEQKDMRIGNIEKNPELDGYRFMLFLKHRSDAEAFSPTFPEMEQVSKWLAENTPAVNEKVAELSQMPTYV